MLEQIAYFFKGNYGSETLQAHDLRQSLSDALAVWSASWSPFREAPCLSLVTISRDLYLLRDTRPGVAKAEFSLLNEDEASIAVSHQLTCKNDLVDWALAKCVGLLIEGEYIPLAVTDPETYQRLGHPQLSVSEAQNH
jgi:hypothetical protein